MLHPSNQSHALITTPINHTFFLQVLHPSNQSHALVTTTVNNTWTVVSGLASGSAYAVRLRGLTATGPGPASDPLDIYIPPSPTPGPLDASWPHGGAVPFPNNTYIIVGISAAAGVLFLALLLVVLLIYKKRVFIAKGPQYYDKGEERRRIISLERFSFNTTSLL